MSNTGIIIVRPVTGHALLVNLNNKRLITLDNGIAPDVVKGVDGVEYHYVGTSDGTAFYRPKEKNG